MSVLDKAKKLLGLGINKRRAVLIALFSLISFSVVGFQFNKKNEAKPVVTTKEPIQVQAIDNRALKKLSEIEERLARLQYRVEHQKKSEVNLNPINSEINALSNEFRKTSKDSNSMIKEQISATYNNVLTELNGLKEEVAALRKKENKNKWLSAKQLPFAVQSIDSIQQQNVVSINYHFKTVPIEKGDSLAGWTLVNASFAKQKAEFVNAKKEHVLVQISDLG